MIVDLDDEVMDVWNNGFKFCVEEWFVLFGFVNIIDFVIGKEFFGDLFVEGMVFVGMVDMVIC